MLKIIENGFTTIIEKPVAIFSIILFVLITCLLYFFRSFGLYKLAKKRKLKLAYLAWIPIVWAYVLFQLVAEFRVFSFSFKKYAILFTCLLGAYSLANLLYNFFTFYPFFQYYLEGGTVEIIISDSLMANIAIKAGADFINHFNTLFIAVLCSICFMLIIILGFVTAIIEVCAFIGLFKKYCPENYILYSILSVLGLFPIFVFVIRNKKAVNFNEYMRSRYYNPYGNGYNSNNGYNNYNNNGYGSNGGYDAQQNKPQEPFEEFNKNKNKPEDPFDEFKN